MMDSCSPLRYPGGKQIIAPVLVRVIKLNGLEGKSYAEPYAGGAGAALSLLYAGYVRSLHLNDADPAIAAMWHSILLENDKFVERIASITLSVDEWRAQKAIYSASGLWTSFDLGFAAFYLNRVNRSGIIKNAGPIGGFAQAGKWKIDARFNRGELIKRVRRIASYRKRISIECQDALDFLQRVDHQDVFVYLDPPYFDKGSKLYLNYYSEADHSSLAAFLRKAHQFKWIMSYDDAAEIKLLYSGLRKTSFRLGYSVRDCRLGSELLISQRSLRLPNGWKRNLPELRSVSSLEDV